MKIKGIVNGMVMQRGDDMCCDVYFYCDEEITSVECSCTTAFASPKVEREGERWHLTGIEVGGPYTLKINSCEYTDIYVGDVWLLAGQSNMQGVGKINLAPNLDDGVRAYYMNNEWGVANHPLHVLGRAKHKIHSFLGSNPGAKSNIGAGPGLAFAEKMKRLTHVPQGVIACAHGGTNVHDEYQWMPIHKDINDERGGSLYAATLDRFYANGSHVAGIFWYQGCSDTDTEVNGKFYENTANLFRAFREDIGDVPIVQVQISRNSWESKDKPETDGNWSSIRRQQLELEDEFDRLDTVSAIASDLEDCIHLTERSQQLLGYDAAESMYCMLHGKSNDCLPAIKLASAEVIADDDYVLPHCHIILHFDNVHGSLTPHHRALGFATSSVPSWSEHCGVNRAECDGQSVIIYSDFGRDEMLDRYVFYGWGINPPCNIFDERGRAVPAFGPVKLRDILK